MTKSAEKFNVAVKFDGKMQPPGTPIPVGGKNGLSEEEAQNLREAFGTWLGGPVANEHAAEDEALSATIVSLTDERDQLSGEVDRLKAENDRLTTDLAKAKLAPSGRSTADLDAEKKRAAALEGENRTLVEDNKTLSDEVKRLTDELAKGKGQS